MRTNSAVRILVILLGGFSAAAVLGPGPVLNRAGAEAPALVTGQAQTFTPTSTARAYLPNQDQIRGDAFTSARVCGECHEDIYNSWKNSLHAFSLTDPVFDTAYMRSIKMEGDRARKLCLSCHAPITAVTGDYELDEGVAREGVTCDFCHTVFDVHLDGRIDAYEVDVGRVKRSVLRNAESPAHEVAFSELHARGEFCGGCHSYVTEDGVAIMSTYSEWRNGPYAEEGIVCQDCHMVLSAGNVAAESIRPRGGQIHLHSLIHDTDQLRSALSVQIDEARREGTLLDIEVSVENVGSGHMVPTGVPTREVVLQVTVEGERRAWTRERRYRKLVADAEGHPLTTDYEALLYGATILDDNRIGPREKRIERFRMEVPVGGLLKVTATISYEYKPEIMKVQPMKIQLGTVSRWVGGPPSPEAGALPPGERP